MTSAALPRPMLAGLMAKLDASRDLALAGGVLAIIAMLILPMPGWLLDLGLALSITLSVMILLTALQIERPLDLSAFPTILLIATMLRLGLNLASTRLILGHGHEGTHAAGGVIAAFGEFLIGGDVVIGLTIFIILVVINFVVITKGAGRIAEVAARFSLDAMPGKQMAIDADLNAGSLTEAEARARRKDVEAESAFYGAMDGASKFVKGDAVAGLLITAINILVGLVVGVASHGLSLGEAFHTYTVLTVGDGLVSQIPALIVSTAAGLLVSKGGASGRAGTAMASQLGRDPKAFGMAAGLLGALALLPGLPFVPFAAFAAMCGGWAWTLSRRTARAVGEAATATQAEQAAALQAEEPVAGLLATDPIRIEIGFGLLPLLQAEGADARLDDQVRALRRQMAGEYGFVLPQVRILDNVALGHNEYAIFVRETEVARSELRLDRLLVISPGEEPAGLPGEDTKEPVFGLPALWVDRSLRGEAALRGLTVVDPGTVIATHLTEVVKGHIADLLCYASTHKLLTDAHGHEKLVADLVPAKLSTSTVQRVLQTLLAEGVSIRDLQTVLEALAEAVGWTSQPTQLAEHVRARLCRQISAQHASAGLIPVVTLSPRWEEAFGEALVGAGDQRHLAMAPTQLQAFVASVRETFDRLAADGEIPCLLASPAQRPFVRSIVERVRPATVVLSQSEIHARARIRTLGSIA